MIASIYKKQIAMMHKHKNSVESNDDSFTANIKT